MVTPTDGVAGEDEAAHRLRPIAILWAALLLPAGVWAADERGDRVIRFNIPQQRADQALIEFAKQADVTFIFPVDATRKVVANEVRGELTEEEAIQKLLSGTGLRPSVQADGELTVSVINTETRRGDVMKKKHGVAGLLAAIVTAFTARGADSGSGEEARASLEEVVVTAQKREERVQDVPMTIIAKSGEELVAAGIKNLQDLSSVVPGLAIRESGPGRQVIALRGIFSLRGSSSLTGVYLDEMPVSGAQDGYTPAYADIRTLDLERVEVLKGPQGTLFGEGGAGGVIRFITKDPDLNGLNGESSAKFYNTSDGGFSSEVNGVVNLPVVENVLGIRLAGAYEDTSGWIDQPSLGRTDINDGEVQHLRVKALFMPVPELQIKALAELHRNDGGASNMVNQRPVENSEFLQAVDRSARTGYTNNYDMYNLTATYDLGSASVLASSSHVELDAVESITFVLGAEPSPLVEVLYRNRGRDTTITSHEVRLTSTADRALNWTLGAAYKDSEAQGLLNSGADFNLGLSGARLRGQQAGSITVQASKSWAGFTEVSYALSDRFEIGGGVRYFSDKREAYDRAVPALGVASGDFSKLTYRVFAKYRPSEQVNLYANLATGFRSGGLNAQSVVVRGADPTFGVENTKFYEVGIKTGLLDGQVRLNAALFSGEFVDMAEDAQIISPIDNRPLQFTISAQNAEVRGVEWDIAWAAADRLTLTFAGDVLQSEITRIKPGALSPYMVGDPVNLIPDYSLAISADYRFDWSRAVPGFFMLTANRQGKSFESARTSGLLPGTAIDKQAVAPEKDFLNARVGGEWRDFEFSLFGRNLLDERDLLNPNVFGGTPQARPRTFGLEFRKTFR